MSSPGSPTDVALNVPFSFQPALVITEQLTKFSCLGHYLGEWWGTSSGSQGRFCSGVV